MKVSRFSTFEIRTATLGALLLGLTAVAGAQKLKHTGPPVTTRGTVKSNEHANNGQVTAESKRVDARDDKAEREVEKIADKREHDAVSAAKGERKSLLRGITLSKSERTSVKATEKKYDDRLKDLDKQAKTLEKAGTPDAALIAKIDALRIDERNELRSLLTPAQVMQFNKNVANLGSRKHSN